MAPTVVVTLHVPEASERLLPPAPHTWVHRSPDPMPRAELLARVATADGLICPIHDRIDRDLLAAAPRLKVVANVAVGYNNVDVAAARARGVVVTNTPDVLTETTADFAWALLMAAARRVVEADRYVRQGRWTRWEWDLLWGADIHGKTLGIIGFGRIGRAVARRATGFGMAALYHDAVPADGATEAALGARRVPLDELCRTADFVTVHTPLGADTRHLVDARLLTLMKPTAILVNAARGPVVDEHALAEALAARRIAGAGLDVFEEEPRVHPLLLGLDNVVLAPHIASASADTRTAMAVLAARNCMAVLEGRPALTPVP